MAIKAGQILHAMNRFIVDRIQTAGAGNLNIPQERVYELGNFQAVGIVRDVPDLTFTVDCLDVDTEVEALVCGSADPSADAFSADGSPASGTKYTLATAKVVDILSPWKSQIGAYNIVKGVAVPALTLESVSYRFGLRENAGESYSFRGDSIFYVPGVPFLDKFVGDGTVDTFAFGEGQPTPAAVSALVYVEQGKNIYALNVSVDGVRQVPGTDYTQTAADVTFTTAPAAGADIRIVYGIAMPTPPAAVTYTQAVHEGMSVKPAAIRGKDIGVYVGGTLASPFRWGDVQAVTVDWRVTLEDDYEFSNPRAVARDATDVPAVTGSIEVKPMTVQRLFDKIQQITGVPANQVVGPQSSVTLPIEVRLNNPDSGGSSAHPVGTTLKTLYIPDARFTLPGYEGRVQQKLTNTINFESDSGVLEIYKGRRF